MRFAFFADLHIQGNKIQSQTDLGSPSRNIALKTQQAINSIKPDYVFGLGDLTTTGSKQDFLGYKKWVKGIKAPVFDLFGNHDRNYNVLCTDNTGREYFTVLDRISDTKVFQCGNIIFILVSEEHNPESAQKLFTSTIPDKRFRFIEKILKKYSHSHNIFILNHTPARRTTVLSDDWIFNNLQVWDKISNNFFELFRKYPIVAHLTGHIHIDYRYKNFLRDKNGQKSNKKIGKFVNGSQFKNLPNCYFLNTACVDTAHGWVGTMIPKSFLKIVNKHSYRLWNHPLVKFYFKHEKKGLNIFDSRWFSKLQNLKGRSAVYYFDTEPNQKNINIITRWVQKNKDVEKYPLTLKYPLSGTEKMVFLESDLSLRDKKNAVVEKHHWFSIPKNKNAEIELSQRFPQPIEIKGVQIKADNLKKYSVFWKGKNNNSKKWSRKWQKNPKKIGKTTNVLVKIIFEKSQKKISVNDVQIVI